MKISPALLNRYIADLPSGSDLIALMEDVGLEVKRHEGETWTLELLANRGDLVTERLYAVPHQQPGVTRHAGH